MGTDKKYQTFLWSLIIRKVINKIFKMTKLMQWLTVFIIYGAVLGVALRNRLPMRLTEDLQFNLIALPIVLIILFGLYSVGVISYRVATFNGCENDATLLKQEIVEAKNDLFSKGFEFDLD